MLTKIRNYNHQNMEYPLPVIKGEEASVIQSILQATAEVAVLLRHSPVIVLESQNKFGDTQLQQDVHADEIIERHLKKNKLVKGFASQERPQLQLFNQSQGGFLVTYDPLDGSSIVDTNFTVGSIYSIWPNKESKLIGQKLSHQKNALITLYGPRTTALFYNSALDKVQQLTLIENKWILSHQHLTIKPKTKLFSPGNLRSAEDNQMYKKIIIQWLEGGYTLRYSGGFAPDAAQILIKGHGIFSCLASKIHKAKLRVLFQVAAIGFLIQKAGGETITCGKKSLMDVVIQTYDDRITFAIGSQDEIQKLKHAF